MGACQDCRVWTADGERLRACTTVVGEGMHILTRHGAERARRDGGTDPYRRHDHADRALPHWAFCQAGDASGVAFIYIIERTHHVEFAARSSHAGQPAILRRPAPV